MRVELLDFMKWDLRMYMFVLNLIDGELLLQLLEDLEAPVEATLQ